MPYGDIDLVNIVSNNGLPLDITKPSSQLMLIISEIMWNSPEGNFRGNTQNINPWYEYEIHWFKIVVISSSEQCFNKTKTLKWSRHQSDVTLKVDTVNTGSGNGLVLNRIQAVTWTSGDSRKPCQITGPPWGPSGSCRPQMDPMLVPWTLLSGMILYWADRIKKGFIF